MKLIYSILYVDDEAQNLRVFKSAFRRRYTITTALSGIEALQLLQDRPFDMLITDQRMPEMTGLDLLYAIRDDYPHMMRIILTGYSDINVIAQAINECRLYRYFTKPWGETEMQIELENAFKSYQLKKENRTLINQLTELNEQLEEKVYQKAKGIIQQKEKLETLSETQARNLERLEQQIKKNKIQAQALQKANTHIQLKNEELERAFFIIHEKNQHITSSIQYAKKIQESILPSPQKLQRIIGEHLLIYRPKDIVSGDFYWIHEFQGGYLVAVIDCTGHGVPGALMSLIGHTLLNGIVKDGNINPSQILAELHQQILKFLHHAENIKNDRSDDGMDVVLCAIYPTENRCIYAGAKRPLWLVDRRGDLSEFAPTRFSIGMLKTQRKPFENQYIELQRGDKIYLFSDGFVDQSNRKRKRLGSKRLKQMIKEFSPLSCKVQLRKMEYLFDEFRSGCDYRDDVTFLGIQF